MAACRVYLKVAGAKGAGTHDLLLSWAREGVAKGTPDLKRQSLLLLRDFTDGKEDRPLVLSLLHGTEEYLVMMWCYDALGKWGDLEDIAAEVRVPPPPGGKEREAWRYRVGLAIHACEHFQTREEAVRELGGRVLELMLEAPELMSASAGLFVNQEARDWVPRMREVEEKLPMELPRVVLSAGILVLEPDSLERRGAVTRSLLTVLQARPLSERDKSILNIIIDWLVRASSSSEDEGMVRDLLRALNPLEAKERGTAIEVMIVHSGAHIDWMITTIVVSLTDSQMRDLVQSSKSVKDILVQWSEGSPGLTIPKTKSPERPGALKRVKAIVDETR